MIRSVLGTGTYIMYQSRVVFVVVRAAFDLQRAASTSGYSSGAHSDFVVFLEVVVAGSDVVRRAIMEVIVIELHLVVSLQI